MWQQIVPDRVLFLLVDFQAKFFPLMAPGLVKEVRGNILLLVKMFKELGVPMVATDHYRKGLGPTDTDVLAVWSGEPPSDKKSFSCLGDETCAGRVGALGRKVAVLAGLETHICVLQTALDLLAQGYQVVVVNDACLSSSKLKWESGLALAEKAGALVMTTETLLFYLLKRIDAPQFKSLVKLLKEMKENNG